MINTGDIYWTAGFLEAEGSFHFGKGRNFNVSAAQIERDPLEKLKEMFGGYINKITFKTGRREIFRWGIGAAKAAGVSMTLYPLMSRKRKQQISAALSQWKDVPLRGRAAKYRSACMDGHPFTTENMYTKRGIRECRQCRRDTHSRSLLRKRAANEH